VGGAQITINLNTNQSAATLVLGSQVSSESLTIPAGGTTITFPVYSNPVLNTTAIQIQATYLGSFQIAQLNVVPWLQSIGITPNSIVGGNQTSGLITLQSPAPTGGITVSLTSDHPSLISFPSGSTLTVPAGQITSTFAIQTAGVAGTPPNAGATFTNVSASVGGVNVSAPLSLLPAGILSVSFSPSEIPSLGQTTGTITLNGQAGPNFSLSLSGLPAGYAYTVNNVTTVSKGTSTAVAMKVPSGASSATFTVTTPYEASQQTVTVTAAQPASANYQASSANGSFVVSVATIKDITMTPNPVAGGGTTVGEVDLNQPAPTGGVIVQLSGNPTYVTFSNQQGNPVLSNVGPGTATLTVPEGSSSATFNVGPVPVSGTSTSTVITATRGTDTASTTLTILAAAAGLTFNTTSVVGGVNAGANQVVGTISLSSVAGPGGVAIDLQAVLASGTGAVPVTVPQQVLVPAGSATVNFPVKTSAVLSNETVDVYFWPNSKSTPVGNHPANAGFTPLLITAPGVISVAFTSTRTGRPITSVVGGSEVSVVVTLNSPAPGPTAGNPKGGIAVAITAVNAQFTFTTVPTTLTIPAGATSGTFTLITRRVSRNQSATITAATAGSSASATLEVMYGF
jgi:hypothetical protein